MISVHNSKTPISNSTVVTSKPVIAEPLSGKLKLSSELYEVKMAECSITNPLTPEDFSQQLLLKENISKTILEDVGLFFKGKNKPCNILTKKRTLPEHMNNYLKFYTGNYLNLKKSVEIGSAVCDHMAKIAYVFSYHRDLSPKIKSYDTYDGKFGHTVCQVTIGEYNYIIDPWANIFCKEEDFINTFKTKVAKWTRNEKFIIATDCHDDAIFAYYTHQNMESRDSIVTDKNLQTLQPKETHELVNDMHIVSIKLYDSLVSSLNKIKNNKFIEHDLD